MYLSPFSRDQDLLCAPLVLHGTTIAQGSLGVPLSYLLSGIHIVILFPPFQVLYTFASCLSILAEALIYPFTMVKIPRLPSGGITKMRYIPTTQQLKERCTTVSAWQLPKQKSALAPDHVWTNEDMDPVRIENQTWTLWTWMAYWATDTINLGTWETASSILSVGLSWREAIPAVSWAAILSLFLTTSLIFCLDCGWHQLCCYSNGVEWSNWSKMFVYWLFFIFMMGAFRVFMFRHLSN